MFSTFRLIKAFSKVFNFSPLFISLYEEEKGMTHAYIQLKSSARCFPSTLQKDSPPVVHICIDKKYELENLLTKTLDQVNLFFFAY